MLYNLCMSNPTDSEIRPTDGLFPIRHVCAETGINPVTLRAWERRYGLIRPLRTPKGHRLYSSEDIAHIRRILALLDEGVAVSQVGRVLQHAAPPAGENGREHPSTTGVSLPDEPMPVVSGGVAPHVLDPLSEALLEATRGLSTVQLERAYARLVMRHGWEGVHETAFLETYTALREKARHDPAVEARLAVFASWALASLTEQLRSALLLCEGPPSPCVVLGTGHRRIGGLLVLLASARQGLRLLPLQDIITAPAMQALTRHLHSPAIVIHTPARSVHDHDIERLRRLLSEDGVPAYLSGSGASDLAGLDTPRQLITLPAGPLQAADTLSRQLLDPRVP
jgi:MerR family transcriptional regulator, light-induced transcriptional regulator